MTSMTSRQRVLAAARREPVDQIPLMLWLEGHTTLKIGTKLIKPRKKAYDLLFKGIRFVEKNVKNESIKNGAPLVSHLVQADYLLELGADLVDFQWGFGPAWICKSCIEDGKLKIRDMYGITRGVGGLYFETLEYPCNKPEDLDSYVFPDISHFIHYEHIRQFRQKHPDVAIACWVPGVQDWGQAFMGMENLYLWSALEKDRIRRFFRKLAKHSMQIIRGVARAGADIIIIGDDYGTNESLLMSKAMWEDLTYPCLAAQCREIHRTDALAFLHSCGSMMPLLDRIVEAGVDILHPLQPTGENDLSAAVKQYGDRLSFATGIDVQKIPSMTPDEVRQSILHAVDCFEDGVGLIITSTNYIQYDTPLENLRAMFDTISELAPGRFSIKTYA